MRYMELQKKDNIIKKSGLFKINDFPLRLLGNSTLNAMLMTQEPVIQRLKIGEIDGVEKPDDLIFEMVLQLDESSSWSENRLNSDFLRDIYSCLSLYEDEKKKAVSEIDLSMSNKEFQEVILCMNGEYLSRSRTEDRITIENIGVYMTRALGYVRSNTDRIQSLAQAKKVKPGQITGQIRDGQFDSYSVFFMEDEKGYVQGMLNGLEGLMQGNVPLNADGYKGLHDTVIQDVGCINKGSMGYRDQSGVTFGILTGKGGNATNAGLNEFAGKSEIASQEEKPDCNSGDYLSYLVGAHSKVIEMSGGLHLVADAGRSRDENAQLAEAVFQNYHARIESCSGSGEDVRREKIKIIAQVCQTLDQLHLFMDGNIRTIYLLMNQMLRENGLTPSLLQDPNIIDMYSIDELADKIIEGQERYQRAV